MIEFDHTTDFFLLAPKVRVFENRRQIATFTGDLYFLGPNLAFGLEKTRYFVRRKGILRHRYRLESEGVSVAEAKGYMRFKISWAGRNFLLREPWSPRGKAWSFILVERGNVVGSIYAGRADLPEDMALSVRIFCYALTFHRWRS